MLIRCICSKIYPVQMLDPLLSFHFLGCSPCTLLTSSRCSTRDLLADLSQISRRDIDPGLQRINRCVAFPPVFSEFNPFKLGDLPSALPLLARPDKDQAAHCGRQRVPTKQAACHLCPVVVIEPAGLNAR